MHDLRVEKIEVFYSIYAAMIVTQNNVLGFKMSESTIRNYLKEYKLGGLTYNDVRIMKHRNRNHEQKTTPHNIPSKIGHHILEGDTMASKVGDNTPISSFLDRRTTFQWLVKISRETQQCFHGSLKKSN